MGGVELLCGGVVSEILQDSLRDHTGCHSTVSVFCFVDDAVVVVVLFLFSLLVKLVLLFCGEFQEE